MSKRLNSTRKPNYQEDQLLFILMSYQFDVDRTKKLIVTPEDYAPLNLKQIGLELTGIFRHLKKMGWFIPQVL
ncbi:hypothetical protein KEM09_15735 [Carboxylicivirga mesophila]|uniref:Uncharacterized protein n=1 Tax=Carboxylicivirga mesophila TaxID=1166478 RepID=A0ABS5KD60_9BACT|nr:hypothetical protein [Carboxylicivirga mesophila]MBS2212869.1 hypothetical protein [Carboxylicivirga mesophila]